MSVTRITEMTCDLCGRTEPHRSTHSARGHFGWHLDRRNGKRTDLCGRCWDDVRPADGTARNAEGEPG